MAMSTSCGVHCFGTDIMLHVSIPEKREVAAAAATRSDAVRQTQPAGSSDQAVATLAGLPNLASYQRSPQALVNPQDVMLDSPQLATAAAAGEHLVNPLRDNYHTQPSAPVASTGQQNAVSSESSQQGAQTTPVSSLSPTAPNAAQLLALHPTPHSINPPQVQVPAPSEVEGERQTAGSVRGHGDAAGVQQAVQDQQTNRLPPLVNRLHRSFSLHEQSHSKEFKNRGDSNFSRLRRKVKAMLLSGGGQTTNNMLPLVIPPRNVNRGQSCAASAKSSQQTTITPTLLDTPLSIARSRTFINRLPPIPGVDARLQRRIPSPQQDRYVEGGPAAWSNTTLAGKGTRREDSSPLAAVVPPPPPFNFPWPPGLAQVQEQKDSPRPFSVQKTNSRMLPKQHEKQQQPPQRRQQQQPHLQQPEQGGGLGIHAHGHEAGFHTLSVSSWQGSLGLSGLLFEIPGCASSGTQAKQSAIGTAGESNGIAEAPPEFGTSRVPPTAFGSDVCEGLAIPASQPLFEGTLEWGMAHAGLKGYVYAPLNTPTLASTASGTFNPTIIRPASRATTPRCVASPATPPSFFTVPRDERGKEVAFRL